MSEFEMRGSYAAHGYASGGYAHEQRVHVPSPSEIAQDSVVEAERDTHDVERRIAELRAAHEANDVERWSSARGRVEVALREAKSARDRMRERTTDLDSKFQTRAEHVERDLGKLQSTAAALIEPPRGYVHIHHNRKSNPRSLRPSLAVQQQDTSARKKPCARYSPRSRQQTAAYFFRSST